MKTQIIRRTVFIVIAIFICYNNNSNQATIAHQSFTNTASKAIPVNTKKSCNATATISCNFSNVDHSFPIIPEPNGDHEFHPFHVKDKHPKFLGFWKNIANKIIEVIYYIVVLIVYMPFKR